MKIAGSMLASLVLVFAFALTAQAEDKKEVSLKGDICCAKCELKVQKDCFTVIRVKNGDKEVVYHFDAASHKKYHKDICTECKKGSIKGTVEKKGDKMTITVTELKYD